jgi:hypothetical protein
VATLLGSIAERWKESDALCALVPFDSFFTGRIPSSEDYPMPYVSVMENGGQRGIRTNKTRMPRVTIVFYVWVDNTQLALGEQIEHAITDEYADANWRYEGGRVMDVLDEGPGIKTQADRPGYKAWEITKIFTLCLEVRRSRVAKTKRKPRNG